MAHTDIEKFCKSIETGEVLVVVYSAGSAPGRKRRIVVKSVDIDADQMTVIERGESRTYFVSKTRMVDEADPAPWVPEKRVAATVVDPIAYFKGWAFDILLRSKTPEPTFEMCESLGVFPRYVINKEKTKLARELAMSKGMTKADATKRVRVMRREIVINTPPAYQFEIGDIFYRGTFGGQDWLQVMAIDTRPDGDFFEIHFPLRDGRIGFSVTAALIELSLRTGQLPASQYRIGITQRSSLMLLGD